MRLSFSTPSFAALAGLFVATMAANAQLTVTEPSGDHWWVAQSLNTLRWTGSTPAEFSVYIANTDQSVIVDKLALIAVQPLYEYSKTVTPPILKVGGGYTIQLTNIINNTQIYATSPVFEIRAAGSPYPAQGTAAPSGNGASASGGASPASAVSSTSSRSGATTRYSTMSYAPFIAGGALAALSLYDLTYDLTGMRGGFIPLAPLAASGRGVAVFNGRRSA